MIEGILIVGILKPSVKNAISDGRSTVEHTGLRHYKLVWIHGIGWVVVWPGLIPHLVFSSALNLELTVKHVWETDYIPFPCEESRGSPYAERKLMNM